MSMSNTVAQMANTIGFLVSSIDVLNQKVADLNERIDNLIKRIANVEANIRALQEGGLYLTHVLHPHLIPAQNPGPDVRAYKLTANAMFPVRYPPYNCYLLLRPQLFHLQPQEEFLLPLALRFDIPPHLRLEITTVPVPESGGWTCQQLVLTTMNTGPLHLLLKSTRADVPIEVGFGARAARLWIVLALFVLKIVGMVI